MGLPELDVIQNMTNFSMVSAIAPLTGRFRGRLVRDIVGALTLGTAISSWYYFGYCKPSLDKMRAYNEQCRQDIINDTEKWFKESSYVK